MIFGEPYKKAEQTKALWLLLHKIHTNSESMVLGVFRYEDLFK